MIRFASILLLFLIACSSDQNASHPNEDAIARVYDKFLYPSDLKEMGIDEADTTGLKKAIIDNWVMNQLLLHNALEHVVISSKIEEQIEEYKASLLTHEYQKALLQKSKIEISELEIAEYYEENQESFLLENTVYSLRFAQLPGNTQQVNSLLESLDNEEVPNFIEDMCSQSPGTCHIDSVLWLDSDYIVENIGLPSSLVKTSSKFKKYTTEKEKLLLYQISEKRSEGDPKPLELVKDVITQILVNKKKKQKLVEIESKLYQNAKTSNEVEIYI